MREAGIEDDEAEPPTNDLEAASFGLHPVTANDS
jgi:hypothetical protein